MNALNTIEQLFANPVAGINFGDFLVALVLSVISALIITLFYVFFYEQRATGSRIHRSFLLISPSITALFIAIQFSLPLSLGLVGALTIIRFRTPIKEPEEVAFIMLVIASSIVCATFHYLLLGVLLALAFVVLLLQRYIPALYQSKRNDGTLLLAVEGNASSTTSDRITWLLEERLTKCRVQSVSYSEQMTTLHYSFTGMKKANLDALTDEIGKIATVKKLNLFFNRQGVLS